VIRRKQVWQKVMHNRNKKKDVHIPLSKDHLTNDGGGCV